MDWLNGKSREIGWPSQRCRMKVKRSASGKQAPIALASTILCREKSFSKMFSRSFSKFSRNFSKFSRVFRSLHQFFEAFGYIRTHWDAFGRIRKQLEALGIIWTFSKNFEIFWIVEFFSTFLDVFFTSFFFMAQYRPCNAPALTTKCSDDQVR